MPVLSPPQQVALPAQSPQLPSMPKTKEESVQFLKRMYPQADEDIIICVLEANQYAIEPSVKNLLDLSNNIPRLAVGPNSFLAKDHERIIFAPKKMHVIPKLHYCIIESPVIKNDKTGEVEMDKYGQARLRHGVREIRFDQDDPFPLYPGEVLVGDTIKPLTIVLDNEALKIKALCDFVDSAGKKRKAGEEYLFLGPSTYLPCIEEEVVEKRKSIIIKPHQALRLRARIDFTDRGDVKRKSGEEYNVTKEGAFTLDAYEDIVETIDAIVLDERTAISLRADKKFADNGVERRKGEQWLLTKEDTSLYIPPPGVKIERIVTITVLTSSEYAIIVDPVGEDGLNAMGDKKLLRGPTQFFLRPNESIESIECVRILAPEDAIYVSAKEPFEETIQVNNVMTTKHRGAGTRWYIYGPREYVPPIQVQEIRRVKAIVALEGLNFYLFNPAAIFALAVAFIYLLKSSVSF
eukprot:gene3697-4259_t